MKSVFKYPLLHIGTPMVLSLPAGSKALAFQFQEATPTMWVEVTSSEEYVRREFQVFGTGHDIPDHAQYVGTVQDDWLVWHLYEVTQS